MKTTLKECSNCKRIVPLWNSKHRLCKDCNFRLNPIELKPRKKIQAVSEKMLNQLAAYRRKRKKYLLEHPECEAKISPLCCGKSDQVHHKKGRGQYLADERYFLAVDFPCHRWIEENVEKAKEMGFSVDRLN